MRGASGLDDELHARGEEGHGRSQLVIAHGEDARLQPRRSTPYVSPAAGLGRSA